MRSHIANGKVQITYVSFVTFVRPVVHFIYFIDTIANSYSTYQCQH